MKVLTRQSFPAVTLVSVALLAATPLPAAAAISASGPVLTFDQPGLQCAGATATLSWTPPTDVTGLEGYKVERYTLWASPGIITSTVGVDTTSVPVTIAWGPNFFHVWAIGAAGQALGPSATVITHGAKAPEAMTWNENPDANTTGDTTAAVSFNWKGPDTPSNYGLAPTTVRVTASPGGATVDIPPGSSNAYGVTATFDGLTNGTSYRFSAVTFNACGSAGPQSSTAFTPGAAPAWTRDSPPLRARPGAFVYKFAATGDPSPTYSLVDGAPAWLAISDKGLLSGRPPEGTTSFSFSVIAANGVGVAHPMYPKTDIVAGPFIVNL